MSESKPPIAVNEMEMAKLLNVSLSWLRKDRSGKRFLPFFKMGKSVRYNPDRVLEALAAVEEGGSKSRGK